MMFLKTMRIKNFRCIKDLTIDFLSGINVLIGENNSGKTAVIDAIRICLSYGRQWRDIYVAATDFHIDRADTHKSPAVIEFDLHFEIEKPIEAGIYNDFLSQSGPDDQELQLHFRYSLVEKGGDKRVKHKVWGGDKEGNIVTPELLDLLYFVHLGALRDAVQSLRPIRGSRLGELYSKLETDEAKKESMANRVRKSLSDDSEWSDLLKLGREKVSEHISATAIEGKTQEVLIDFLPFEFRKIVDMLRIQMPVQPQEAAEKGDVQVAFELHQNGLGYNNLIYTAVVLGDLKRKKEIEEQAYVALLIEEPEAHLHPQLQNVFFNYLNTLNQIGFQIFVTSHSPTITAKADLDSLVVLQRKDGVTNAFAVRDSSLEDHNKKYLQKFLDVTKSQLLFSNGVILVEGICEALLLPVFSRLMGSEYDLDKTGIEVVNLAGVAFEHFGKLFIGNGLGRKLGCRCAILTDDDRKGDAEISSRAVNAKKLEGELLKVELAAKNLEYELFLAGDNKGIMLQTFAMLHPKAAENIDHGASIEEFAMNFVERVGANKAKSELAHTLALRIQDEPSISKAFTVPVYITKAVRWVTKGE